MLATRQAPPTPPGLLAEARHLVLPAGIVATGFPAVERTCETIGIRFDPWQRDLNTCLLAKSSSGEYAADTAVISICRQAGKTFDIGGLVFADSIINPETTTVWTAHRFKVSRETFDLLRALARSPLLAPHIDYEAITTGAGNEVIPFRNGSRIVFAARERGAIRGFSKVRRLVLDEAQILTHASLADLAPTMNQSENPQIILMGTPPKPSDPSEVFADLRSDALNGETEGVLYVEFGARPGSQIDDRTAWREANPSYPRRTPAKAILRLRKLLSEDDFRREALGIWDEVGSADPSVISAADWALLAVDAEEAPKDGAVAFGVKFSPDGRSVALSVALRPDGGAVHVEGVRHESMVAGTAWLLEWLVARWQMASLIVVDGKSGAGGLVQSLRLSGVPARRVLMPSTEQVIAAHSMLLSAVVEKTLTHLEDPALDGSIASSGRRKIGNNGGWGFQTVDGGDVTLAESVVLAHFGVVTGKRPRSNGHGNERRRVVVRT
jgi:hypothetical protein